MSNNRQYNDVSWFPMKSPVISERKVHICVCVCTYKRPVLLETLLKSLAAQKYEAMAFDFEIVLVDNDSLKSAGQTVDRFRWESPAVNIRYLLENKQGISYARNKAVAAAASADYIAFIDDDEIADPNWLAALYQTAHRSGCAAVLGPVLPIFPPNSPAWARRSGYFDRPRHMTGEAVNADEGRTGNALLRGDWLRKYAPPFDERYALTGGEDYDFFRRLSADGGQIRWCDEAVVHETVPLDRQRIRWVLERALRGSSSYWRMQWQGGAASGNLAHALAGALAGLAFTAIGVAVCVPSLALALRCWVLAAKGFGRVLALTDIKIESYRGN